jgi:hypothetical protein
MVKGCQFTVIIHTVKINRTETADQQRALAELQAQNWQLKDKVEFLKLA